MSRPKFQFRVSRCAQPREIIIPPRVEIDPVERLRVAAVEALSKPDHR
jgi:hypothetical protein